MNSREFAEELEESRIWGHKPRTFILDRPFYDFLPIPPPIPPKIPKVNFDLCYKE